MKFVANKKLVEMSEFERAKDKIMMGAERRSMVMSEEEKKLTAYHEAGHAAVSWLTKYANPLVKVTIVPRGRSLGAAWYLPEERQITTKEQMLDEMCAALGGRAAEEIVFGAISTGALSDLEKITKQAYAMVSVYGLNDKIGNISFYDSSGQSEYSFSKPYSEKTGQIIDEEVSKMVEEAYVRTKKILLENKDKLALLAQKLLEKEVIYKDDLEAIFGERSFGQKSRVDTLMEENEKAKAFEKENISKSKSKAKAVNSKTKADSSSDSKVVSNGKPKSSKGKKDQSNSQEEGKTKEKSAPKEEKAE